MKKNTVFSLTILKLRKNCEDNKIFLKVYEPRYIADLATSGSKRETTK